MIFDEILELKIGHHACAPEVTALVILLALYVHLPFTYFIVNQRRFCRV